MRTFFSLLFLCSFLLSAQSPAAKFELSSIPLVSRAASRLDNAIAPRFRDTAATATLMLTMGAARFGMDLTRPADLLFYSFGEKPAMRIVAYALPGIKEPQDHANLWGLRFHARQQGDLIAFDSEGVNAPFPTVPPGKNVKAGELLRGTIQAETVHKHFQFSSFNTKNHAARLILKGLDELLAEIKEADVIFSEDEQSLKVELVFRPKKESVLRQWMKQPLPARGKIETFSGAQTLTVLQLPPTETLRRYGKAYVEHGKTNLLPSVLPAAVNGFAVMAICNSGPVPSSRLTVGIDPSQSAVVRKEIRKWNYTPYPDWFQLRRQPPLFCSENAGQIIFCSMDLLDRATLENLLRPQNYQGSVPNLPFICLDLNHPDRPLAELRFEQDFMHLILQAPDSWFSACRPLLEKPLLLPGK
ncbi:MAG: hypothetical protein J5858_01210 [Lentisphaeria bacterium]|nr:hypothetical protein [Lentisphaeria bacterium]